MQGSVPASPLFPAPWAAILAVCILVGLLLRLWPAGTVPLWIDEGYSYWFSTRDWRFLWEVVPRYETVPPLFYAVLKGWRMVAGSSELALRMPSIIAGVLLIPVVALAGRRAGGPAQGPALGVLAAAAAALWPMHITYSMEARGYAAAVLGTGLVLMGGLRIVTAPAALCQPIRQKTRRRTTSEAPERSLLAAGLAVATGMALLVWMHPLGTVTALVAGLFLVGWWLVRLRGNGWAFLRLLAVAAVAAALLWPNRAYLESLAGRDVSGFWAKAPEVWRLVQMTLAVHASPLPPPAIPVELKLRLALAAIVLPGGLFGLFRALRDRPERRAILAFVVILAGGHWLGIVGLTYLKQPVLFPRTLLIGLPPTLLIVAGLPWAFPPRGWTAVAAGLTGCLLASALITARQGHPERVPYDRMVMAIATAPAEDRRAPVLVFPAQAMTVLDYYDDRQGLTLDLRGLPRDVPDFSRRPPRLGVGPMKPEDGAAVETRAGGATALWLVLVQPQYDPDGLILARLATLGYRVETVIDAGPEGALYHLRQGQ